MSVLKELRQKAEDRLRKAADREGVSVETLLERLPIREPGNGTVPMTGSVYRALGKVKSRKEVDSELAKPFRFARR